jgi:peptidyl-prolyl cis-trans isomerase C
MTSRPIIGLAGLAAFISLWALAAGACKAPGGSPLDSAKKSGPAVANGNGVTITVDEFKAKLDEQSPFIRARYSTLDRKKEFLDNLVRFEVLANEARKRGLDRDPEVLSTLKKVMVQKLIRQEFDDTDAAKNTPEDELKKYYDEHLGDYVKAERIRVSHIFFAAEKGKPERSKKGAEAKKMLTRVSAEEQGGKNPQAFATFARDSSDDQASKAVGGDLTYKTRDELAQQFTPELASAAFALKDIGQLSAVVETPKGFHIIKLTGRQAELNRPFDQVKTQIANKLYREKRTKEFDEYVKKLKEDAKVSVNDGELEKIVVAAAPTTPPGMPGAPGSMMPGQPGPGGMTVTPSQPMQPAPPKPPPPGGASSGTPHGTSPAAPHPPHP